MNNMNEMAHCNHRIDRQRLYLQGTSKNAICAETNCSNKQNKQQKKHGGRREWKTNNVNFFPINSILWGNKSKTGFLPTQIKCLCSGYLEHFLLNKHTHWISLNSVCLAETDISQCSSAATVNCHWFKSKANHVTMSKWHSYKWHQMQMQILLARMWLWKATREDNGKLYSPFKLSKPHKICVARQVQASRNVNWSEKWALNTRNGEEESEWNNEKSDSIQNIESVDRFRNTNTEA